MAEDTNSESGSGRAMLALTAVLGRSLPTLVGTVFNRPLPRAVKLVDAVAVVIGFVLGLVGTAVVGGFIGYGVRMWVAGPVLGAIAAYGLVNWSPIEGESLPRAVWVYIQSRRGRVVLGGNDKPLHVSIGMAPLEDIITGPVKVRSRTVEVNPDLYDERGVYRSAANKNEIGTRLRYWPIIDRKKADERDVVESLKMFSGEGPSWEPTHLPSWAGGDDDLPAPTVTDHANIVTRRPGSSVTEAIVELSGGYDSVRPAAKPGGFFQKQHQEAPAEEAPTESVLDRLARLSEPPSDSSEGRPGN